MDRKYLKKILESPLGPKRNWTVTGFGKIGFMFAPNTKIHVWDRSVLDPAIPAIHSHSYDFRSFVVVGKVRNVLFKEDDMNGETMNRVIVTSSGQVMDGPVTSRLIELETDEHAEGDVYSQKFDEVHWSCPDDGTVTVVEWEFGADPQHMRVYWRGKYPWVDAKAHQAKDADVTRVCKRVLDLWY